jgi:hypothetical protein
MVDVRLLAMALVCALGTVPTGVALADTDREGPAESVSERPPAADAPPGGADGESSAGSRERRAGEPQETRPGAELDDIGRARECYREAESRYAAGEIEAALGLMECSHRLSGRPELLFNLGQLNRELRRCQPARAWYRLYLEKAPSGRRRADAVRIVTELERECPEPARAPPPPPAGTHRSYWTPIRVGAWAALGAGVATGTGALLFGLSVMHTQNNMDALPNNSPSSVYNALRRDGYRYQAWEIGLGATSAGLLAGGVVLLVWGAPAKPSAAPLLSVVVEPGGARARCAFEF